MIICVITSWVSSLHSSISSVYYELDRCIEMEEKTEGTFLFRLLKRAAKEVEYITSMQSISYCGAFDCSWIFEHTVQSELGLWGMLLCAWQNLSSCKAVAFLWHAVGVFVYPNDSFSLCFTETEMCLCCRSSAFRTWAWVLTVLLVWESSS